MIETTLVFYFWASQLAQEDNVQRINYLKSSRREAPGPDHGGDPHDEKHDRGLPANKGEDESGLYPSSDPYNDTTKNDKDHPYKPY